jgi:hypothetical protein
VKDGSEQPLPEVAAQGFDHRQRKEHTTWPGTPRSSMLKETAKYGGLWLIKS